MRPVLGLGQRAQEQGGRVVRAIEDARPQAALDHLAVADLVEDLARLFLALRVDATSLVRGEVAQHAARE